jgi:hypothetical protein
MVLGVGLHKEFNKRVTTSTPTKAASVWRFCVCVMVAGIVGCGGGNGSPISGAPPSNLSYASPVTAVVGVPLAPLLPSVTGSVTAYSVAPALPAGLSFNTATGAISGAPDASVAQATYVVTASNSSGSTTFAISLAVDIANGPAIALSASSLTFANQLVSTVSPSQMVAAVNIGSAPAAITSVTLSGANVSAFDESNACGELQPGAACMITVTFTPPATGLATAMLNIATNAPTNPAVELFGTGTMVQMGFSPSVIPAGQTAMVTWSAPSAASCTASGAWSGPEPTRGTLSVTQTTPGYYAYDLNCGPGATNSAVLTVSGATPSVNEPANELGYQAAFYVAPPNQLVGLQTTMLAPVLPPIPTEAGAALFLWPGLGPATSSANFDPINDGVLQPVLSWGPSCAPTAQPTAFSSWWISAQYVNTFGSAPGYAGCYSGTSILISPGDTLLINMTLDQSSGIWTQAVTDSVTKQSASFAINLQGQGQNWAYFAMELWYDATIHVPVTFTNTTLTFQSPDTANWCSASQGANNAYILSPPTPQDSGSQCVIDSIVVTNPR